MLLILTFYLTISSGRKTPLKFPVFFGLPSKSNRISLRSKNSLVHNCLSSPADRQNKNKKPPLAEKYQAHCNVLLRVRPINWNLVSVSNAMSIRLRSVRSDGNWLRVYIYRLRPLRIFTVLGMTLSSSLNTSVEPQLHHCIHVFADVGRFALIIRAHMRYSQICIELSGNVSCMPRLHAVWRMVTKRRAEHTSFVRTCNWRMPICKLFLGFCHVVVLIIFLTKLSQVPVKNLSNLIL